MRWYIAGYVGGWFISRGVPPVWFGAGINHLTDHGHFINHLVDERAAHNQYVRLHAVFGGVVLQFGRLLRWFGITFGPFLSARSASGPPLV